NGLSFLDLFRGIRSNQTTGNLAVGALGGGRFDNLSIDQPGDQDLFKFQIVAGAVQGHYVRIDFDNGLGNLDLFLYDSAGNLIGSSTGTGNNEQISLAGRSAGSYYVQVKGAGNVTNPHYALSIAAPQATIAPDAFEPN